MDTLDLLLHPVRLRITHAMSGGRTCSAVELCAVLRDVPKSTVYRHVGLLAEGGVLEVAGEQRVRGAVERRYRLRRDRMAITPEAGASMSLDDHRRGFAAAMAVLLAEFNAYLDRPGAAPFADSVGYRQGVYWLSPDELAEMIDELRHSFASRAGNGPAPGRRPHLMSPIFFPAEEPVSCEEHPDGRSGADGQGHTEGQAQVAGRADGE
ncbi:helix-turn-helix domain-containing protein [Streptomyces yunnanensis]|uniref:Helix-turn-helix domain-containing protein n=1 Tax=Streptomyces yunnanensis TaxID=156453 RepID=A0A9X8MXV0_9ACTN|nr:helix-turn-helix domain-containing protein [Streptomyces yunnanensis]SHM22781.1 Helix-turn-helix domain-containing protein [Streptomyces yunnanensis]